MITTMHSDQNASPPRVEVITSVQRRRRWPTAEKIRLVEETMRARDVGFLHVALGRSRRALPACCSTGRLTATSWRGRPAERVVVVRLTKMSWARAGSVSWNDGCANWSACSAARPWKPRFSRKRLRRRAGKKDRETCSCHHRNEISEGRFAVEGGGRHARGRRARTSIVGAREPGARKWRRPYRTRAVTRRLLALGGPPAGGRAPNLRVSAYPVPHRTGSERPTKSRQSMAKRALRIMQAADRPGAFDTALPVARPALRAHARRR